ncbi:hypothetical protein [Chitinophaga sp. RAB17]|uniref:hypothetical protein n=1 Tax=Chitinophaga sp. RAB17 TaxID=3233049 RepID=UPI003F915290
MKSTYTLIFLSLLFVSCSKTETADLSVGDTNPPLTLKEHWFDYQSELKRVYLDDQVATYLAPDMDTTLSLTFYNNFSSRLWKYTKEKYGNFGDDPHLLVTMHDGEYLNGGGFFGTLSTYRSSTCDYKNLVVVSSTMWKDSAIMSAVLAHEVGHIVEFSSMQRSGSPTFKLWGDSKLMDIFIYDVYLGLGLQQLADDSYSQSVVSAALYPRPGTYWFRDWWYPVYMKYGKTTLLVNYFKILAANLAHEKDKQGFENYTEDVNLGEFVHFMSGAAGADLKAQAKIAFGWTMENEQQLINAKEDYPNVKY